MNCTVTVFSTEDTCVEGDVRLMGGSDAKEGRVEICRENVWGTVCNDSWTDANSLVVCTQLGLQSELELMVLEDH